MRPQILVTGASGKVGAEAVRVLETMGRPVRALVRDASRSNAAEVAVGDFDRPDALDAAMAGIETVILVSPAVPAQENAVIDAAVRGGAKRVIKITSKASLDSPVDRRRGQARIEAYLASSGLAFTFLRANAYLQNLLALAPMVKQTQGFVMSAGDGQVGMIDARDVALTAAHIALVPEEHAGRTYQLTGPRLITYGDVAQELSASLGYPVEYRRISPEQHLAAMIEAGVPEAAATSNAQAFGLIAEGDAAWLSDDVQTITGAVPRDLRTFITDFREAFSADEPVRR